MKDALKDMDLEDRINWASGKLILAIGAGNFRSELSLVTQVLETNAVARHEEYLQQQEKGSAMFRLHNPMSKPRNRAGAA